MFNETYPWSKIPFKYILTVFWTGNVEVESYDTGESCFDLFWYAVLYMCISLTSFEPIGEVIEVYGGFKQFPHFWRILLKNTIKQDMSVKHICPGGKTEYAKYTFRSHLEEHVMSVKCKLSLDILQSQFDNCFSIQTFNIRNYNDKS